MKLKEKIVKNKQYDGWHFVKQSYNFEILKHFIFTINKFHNTETADNFEIFNKKIVDNVNEKSKNNFRTAKALVDLNFIENPLENPGYKNYKIADSLILAKDDIDLRQAMIERMMCKNYIIKLKSNKKGEDQDKIILNISPFKIFFNVLILLNKKTNSKAISINEIAGVIVKIESDEQIEEAVDIIISSRNGKFNIPKISENRFNRALLLFDGIIEKGNNYFFDIDRIKEYLELIVIDGYVFKKQELVESDFFSYTQVKTRNANKQITFKKKLLEEFKKCALCNIDNSDLIRASHIKSVGDSLKEKKYHEFPDHNNGILLCVFHDYLFDQHFITFDDKGNLIGELYGLNTPIRNIGVYVNSERKKYLIHHNNIYKIKRG